MPGRAGAAHRRGGVSAAYISPISPLRLACISPASFLHLATSRLPAGTRAGSWAARRRLARCREIYSTRRGDIAEMQGRCRGDVGKIRGDIGRCRQGVGQRRGAWPRRVDVSPLCLLYISLHLPHPSLISPLCLPYIWRLASTTRRVCLGDGRCAPGSG